MLIDSHCHFDINKYSNQHSLPGFDTEFHSNRNLLERAEKAGVTHILAVGTDLNDSHDTIDLSENATSETLKVYATVGIHPDNAKETIENFGIDKTVCELTKLSEGAIGIGEFGLDYRNEQINKNEQLAVFEVQMNLAVAVNKPVVIHSRYAENDTISVLKKFNGDLHGIIHCFSGSKDFARKSLDLGYYISFSGILTFKNANELRDIAKNYIPKDRVLIETDAPFLAPSPYRGKTNEPAYIVETAKCLAEQMDISFDEVCELTSRNFLNLFGV